MHKLHGSFLTFRACIPVQQVSPMAKNIYIDRKKYLTPALRVSIKWPITGRKNSFSTGEKTEDFSV
jgi:hypothetical protein